MQRVLLLALAVLALAFVPLGTGGFVTLQIPLTDIGQRLVVAQFDGDAHPDVAVVIGDNFLGEARLELFSGVGDGGLTQEQSLALSQFGYASAPALSAADLNDDGLDDLGLTEVLEQAWINQGAYDFDPKGPLPTAGGEAFDVTFADIDGDDDLDSVLLVRDFSEWYLDTGLNDGLGNFRNSSFFFAPGDPTNIGRVIFADLNGDSVDDHIVTSAAGLNLNIAPVPHIPILAGQFADVRTGDFNEDGALDLVVAAHLENAVYVLLNDGNGAFPVVKRLRVGRRPVRLAVGDLRGGGQLDIAVANRDGDNVTVLAGKGNGNFGLGATLPVSADPVDIALADMDADGDVDIVVLGRASQELLVLLNPRLP